MKGGRADRRCRGLCRREQAHGPKPTTPVVLIIKENQSPLFSKGTSRVFSYLPLNTITDTTPPLSALGNQTPDHSQPRPSQSGPKLSSQAFRSYPFFLM